jgi:hypothetical protein
MDRTNVINLLIDYFNFKFYLEIGVRNPNHNFNKIVCEHKVGVDIKDIDLPNYQFFHGTSNDFFEKSQFKHLENHWDCIFIDGDHRYEQVLRDFRNSYNALHNNGVIILHDVNPISKETQGPKKKSGDWAGEVWKWWYVVAKYMELDVFTIDCDYGVGIIRKNVLKSNLIDLPETSEMVKVDYKWFGKNKEVLSLIEPKAETIIEQLGFSSGI